MNPAQSRLAGLALIALAVIGWSWAFDQRQSSQALRESLDRLVSQRDLLSRGAPEALPVVRQRLVETAADRDRLRLAAAGFGSDARNFAAALGRMSDLCTASGLEQCQIRRALVAGSLATAPRGAAADRGGASTSLPEQPDRQLTPYTVTMLTTFNPKGLAEFLRLLRLVDVLYRLDRLVVMQNRMELDVVFLHSDELRPSEQPSALRAAPARGAAGG